MGGEPRARQMTDTKKRKLSEIVWRNAVSIKSLRNDKGTIGGEGALAISEGVHTDIPHLLDLVETLAEMTNRLISSHHGDRHEGLEWEDCDYPKCRAARALLLEVKE